MQVRDVEGVATHNGPESCGGAGNRDGEALTGEHAGRVLSPEMETRNQVPTRWRSAEGPIRWTVRREVDRDLAGSETPSMRGHTATGNREVPWSPEAMSAAGRIGESTDTRR